MPDILRGGLSVDCVRLGVLLRNVVWNTLPVPLDAAHLPYGVQQFLCSVHRQRGVNEEVPAHRRRWAMLEECSGGVPFLQVALPLKSFQKIA